jgi:nucleoside-diphosphate-sugar epimerase
LSGPRTLVTGVAGLIGGAVARRLADGGSAVIGTDAREARLPRGLPFAQVDLTDRFAFERLIRGERIERIIHCGAISGPMVAAGDPHLVMSANVVGTLTVVETARQCGVARMVALSSASVYGTQADFDPVKEEAPLNATDIYGCSKIAAEVILRAYRDDHGVAITVLRPSSVYGPGRATACFIRDLIDAAARRTPIIIDRSGSCRRQFVHIDDVVRAVLAAADQPATDVFAFNIAGATWLTEEEVVELAAAALPGLALADASATPRCLDGRMGPLDCGRAAQAFCYKPGIKLAEGISAYARSLG